MAPAASAPAQDDEPSARAAEEPQLDPSARRKRVGIAMLPTKAAKHLRPELIEAVGKAGYEIVPVVPGKLSEAGKLDALLHKIRTPAWKLELEEYSSDNPETLVLDPPDRVAALQSRATMLSPLQGTGRRFDPPQAVVDAAKRAGGVLPSPVVVAAPSQVVIPEGATAETALEALSSSGLSPPLLAKPLHAGTTACGGSHALALLDDVAAVAALAEAGTGESRTLPHWRPPVVLQPYVRHPTPLFKVFVMGPLTVVARRPSLRVPPPPGDVTTSVGGAHAIARVSAYVSAEDDNGADGEGGGDAGDERRDGGGDAGDEERRNGGGDASGSPSPSAPFEAPDPPRWALEALAAHLRSSLGLNLFNFDLITVDKTTASSSAAPPDADYLVIDINYFPGFEKLPDYEGLLIEFLGWLFRPRTAGRIRSASGGGGSAAVAPCAPPPPPQQRQGGDEGEATAAETEGATAAAGDLEAKLLVGGPGGERREQRRAPPATPGGSSPRRAAGAPPPSSSFSAPPSAAPSPSRVEAAASVPVDASPADPAATASSAGSSPLRGGLASESAASLQKLARSLSQRPVSFPRVGGSGGMAAAAAAAVARREEAEKEEREKEKEKSSAA